MIKKLFIVLLACAAFCACDKEEPQVNNELQYGEETYLSIRLVNAGSDQTRGTDGGYLNGIALENDVNTAEFYFFDATGAAHTYVEKALSWTATNNGTGNIEKFADATIVLRGLKEKGTPESVVVVLNGTPKAYQNKSLEELKAAISKSYLTGKYFIMTNSTYNDTSEVRENFATRLFAKNFLREKPTPETLTPENTVSIYVERLACKVDVVAKTGLLQDSTITLDTLLVDGVKTAITLKVLGWGLNATAKDSYVMKRVPDWNTDLGFTWDKNSDYRSFWAKSTNYGVAPAGKYPLSYENVVDDKKDVTKDYLLNYISWNELNEDLGSIEYCMENTNTADVLNPNNFYAKATCVLLKAQIATEGITDLVRYDGQLLSANGFINKVLNQLNLKGKAYKVLVGAESTTYEALSADDLEVVNAYDGRVTVQYKEAAKNAVWTATVEGEVDEDFYTTVLLPKLQGLNVTADYYKTGMMYYCIPIEHLRQWPQNSGLEFDATLKANVLEAYYGVVRNHYYRLTINSIENLGTSVYDPDEKIIPNPNDPTYYVGAEVNILSWKVVNQGADL